MNTAPDIYIHRAPTTIKNIPVTSEPCELDIILRAMDIIGRYIPGTIAVIALFGLLGHYVSWWTMLAIPAAGMIGYGLVWGR